MSRNKRHIRKLVPGGVGGLGGLGGGLGGGGDAGGEGGGNGWRWTWRGRQGCALHIVVPVAVLVEVAEQQASGAGFVVELV